MGRRLLVTLALVAATARADQSPPHPARPGGDWLARCAARLDGAAAEVVRREPAWRGARALVRRAPAYLPGVDLTFAPRDEGPWMLRVTVEKARDRHREAAWSRLSMEGVDYFLRRAGDRDASVSIGGWAPARARPLVELLRAAVDEGCLADR